MKLSSIKLYSYLSLLFAVQFLSAGAQTDTLNAHLQSGTSASMMNMLQVLPGEGMVQPLSSGAPVISYGAARTFAVNEQINWAPTNSGDAATFSVIVEQTLLSGYYNPLNTASAADGSLYITNTGYHSILKRTAAGVQTVFAGGNSTVYGYVNGTGTAARFRHPSFLAIDASGNIFVADQQNHRIRKITPSGVVTTFAGSGSIGSANGTGTAASFHYPMGLAFDGSGNLYVADAYNNKIRKITPSGVVSDYAGSGVQGLQDGTVLTARFYQPKSLYFDSNGDLYVADRLNNILRKVSGGNVTTVAGNGTTGFVDGQGSAARFNGFSDFVIRRGNIYSVDMLNNALRYISPSGNVITISTSGQITNPFSISEDAAGKLYIAENTSHRIKKVSVQQAYSISPALPSGLTFDHSTGKISGKLSAVTASQSYTVTARNTSGTSTSTLTFSVGGSSGGTNFGSSDQNYILETLPRRAYKSVEAMSGKSVDSVNRSIQYFDGLGRPMQSVQWQASSSKKDVVQHIEYDGFGRESKRYLPYSTTGAGGSFRPSAATAQATFYSAPPIGITASTHPYSVTVFENSPLDRVLEQGAPGNFWQPLNGSIPGSGHTIKTEYTTNNLTAFTDITNTRRVSLYSVNIATDGTPSLDLNGAYGVGQLYVYITKDEDWKPANGRAGTSEEYVDKEGRTVLKRMFNKKSDGGVEMLSTYFVFDDFGDLTYVLPPGRTGEFDPDRSTVPTSVQLNNFCYQYRFDGRRRMVEKRLPGKDVEYLVYNNNDQVVLTQDAIQRAKSPKEWTFTKYDAFGRIVMTGRYTTTLSNRSELQNLVNSHMPLWEAPHTTNATRYTNTAFPNGNGAEVYSYIYYDDYNLPTDCPAAWRTLASSYTPMTQTLRTATKTKILGTTNYLWSVNYYDDRARMVRTNSQHHHGGTDVILNTYDFLGHITTMTRTHSKGSTSTIVKERYEYDHQGRLVNTYHQVNTQPEVLLVSNTYGELGELLVKKLHSEDDGSNYLQQLDHRYNIRGWLISINGTNLNAAENDLFGFEVKYTDDERVLNVHPGYYNGNIAEVAWNTSRTNKPRAYAFQYDNLNRLLSADYRAHNGNWTTDVENGRFTEGSFAYDKMGNIQQLKRFGTTGTTSLGVMDDLEYTYTGNRLLKVNEKTTGNRSYGFKEPTPTTANEYTYDVNGNLKIDINKGITGVSYNYLNLPEQVSIGGNNISYLYSVEGVKLRKIAGTNVTHYINGIHYNGDQIHFIQTSEGRLLRSPSTGQYAYEYHLKDHQNNVRVAFDKNTSTGKARIIQEDSYYPFGIAFNSYVSGSQNKYTFQGQEIQDEYGLNWSQFKWRMHDPAIGRFVSIDPLATDYTHNSPYAFSENRVINGVELEGLEYASYSYNVQGVRDIQRATARESSRTETEKLQDAAMKIDAIPFVGDAKGFVEAFTGKDMVTGEKLSGLSRALGFFLISELRIAGNVGNVAKKVPNPHGKKGGEAHQNTIKQVEADLKSEGFDEIRNEVVIETPGGEKTKRFIDVQGKNTTTGEVQQVQVGKQNQNGTPVARERRAMDDVEKVSGTRPAFRPYNKKKEEDWIREILVKREQ